MLDREAVGLGLTVFVESKVERHSRENTQTLRDALAAMPDVVSCHMVSGTADILAEVVLADLGAYEALLTVRLLVLPMVADTRSNIRYAGSGRKLPCRGLACDATDGSCRLRRAGETICCAQSLGAILDLPH